METVDQKTNLAQKLEELTSNWSNFHSQNEQVTSQLKEKIENMEKQYKNFALSLERPDGAFITKRNTFSEEGYMSDYIRKGNIHPNLIKKNTTQNRLSSKHEEAVIEHSMSHQIISSLAALSPIRSISSVEEISTGAFEVAYREKGSNCYWGYENHTREKSEIKGDKILLHELYSETCVPSTLLEDDRVNVERLLITEFSQNFATAENKGFLTGTGNKEPKGILPALKDENVKKITQQISTEDLINLASMLDVQYQNNATFLMNKDTLLKIQALKDDSGRFLWHPRISDAISATLLGYPVICCAEMPKLQAEEADGDKTLILLGDFKAAYKIIDHGDISILRDPYSNKPFVSFYAVKRVGGALLNNDAIVAIAKTNTV